MANTKSEQSGRLQQSKLPSDTGTGSQPTHLDLFSGIGGFALAAQWAGFRTIGFCEIDKYCRKVLAKNFKAVPDSAISRPLSRALQGILRREEIPGTRDEQSQRHSVIHGNIFDLDGTSYRGVSLLTGGFPCQPFSVAGKRRGAADDRAIWPQMFRVISEARPAWVLGENVPGIIGMELDNVLSDLEGIGYACRSFVIPACAVDARHRRDRVWIVARNISNSARGRCEQRNTESKPQDGIVCTSLSDLEHSAPSRQRQYGGNGLSESESIRSGPSRWNDEREWSIKSGMGRVAHGVRNRVDRLKGLGNAIVPQVAYQILKEIRKLC